MNKYIRLYNTIKFLQPIQVYYRFFYFFKLKFRNYSSIQHRLFKESQIFAINLESSIKHCTCYQKNKFTFLNHTKTFTATIDWNFSEYGRLWTYNLAYFDFLHQKSISKEEGLILIHDFIDQSNTLKDALEPFPISLRGINWIKFLVHYNIIESIINDSLFTQYNILLENLEYHLLGNHLLENGFSLLYGAYYFQNEKFYIQAKRILSEELEEQILSDGAHFELSPMYHQIMLSRILDCINLVKNNPWKQNNLLTLLENKASIMLGWLTTITYSDGSIPLLNDSANGIAPPSQVLFEYAHLLGILPIILPLKESGYRKIVKDAYECIIDVGDIGPDYIPGHAHSDTFNFELRINGKPLIIDTGISTYESNQLRQTERSTAAHNTVMINGIEQSEVWGGFRVANRAKVIHLIEYTDSIEATHDGYLKIGALHTRKFTFDTHTIIIEDSVKGKKLHQCIAYLHCHPDVTVTLKDNTIQLNNVKLTCFNHNSLSLNTYNYAPEFNIHIPAIVIEITFNKTLKMEIAI
jgi:hypothetical protein